MTWDNGFIIWAESSWSMCVTHCRLSQRTLADSWWNQSDDVAIAYMRTTPTLDKRRAGSELGPPPHPVFKLRYVGIRYFILSVYLFRFCLYQYCTYSWQFCSVLFCSTVQFYLFEWLRVTRHCWVESVANLSSGERLLETLTANIPLFCVLVVSNDHDK